MADINNQKKIPPESQKEIAQLLKRRKQEIAHAQRIQTFGKVTKKLGSLLGSKKVASIGAEAQAIGAESQDTGYIKQAIQRRDAARTGEQPLEPGAPIGIKGSPLATTDEEAVADYLQKQGKDAEGGEEGKEEAEKKVAPEEEKQAARDLKQEQRQAGQETEGVESATTADKTEGTI